jgi:DNA-directed RNA polymerase specialized sigma24 family protein
MASKQDTDDLLQDAYRRAADKLGQFRSDALLKTWVPLPPRELRSRGIV